MGKPYLTQMFEFVNFFFCPGGVVVDTATPQRQEDEIISRPILSLFLSVSLFLAVSPVAASAARVPSAVLLCVVPCRCFAVLLTCADHAEHQM